MGEFSSLLVYQEKDNELLEFKMCGIWTRSMYNPLDVDHKAERICNTILSSLLSFPNSTNLKENSFGQKPNRKQGGSFKDFFQ